MAEIRLGVDSIQPKQSYWCVDSSLSGDCEIPMFFLMCRDIED